jgi:hypothetical protein
VDSFFVKISFELTLNFSIRVIPSKVEVPPPVHSETKNSEVFIKLPHC